MTGIEGTKPNIFGNFGSASDYCWEGEDILPTPAMVSQSCSLCRRALVATVLPDPVEITHH